jgi:hypothetical protein
MTATLRPMPSPNGTNLAGKFLNSSNAVVDRNGRPMAFDAALPMTDAQRERKYGKMAYMGLDIGEHDEGEERLRALRHELETLCSEEDLHDDLHSAIVKILDKHAPYHSRTEPGPNAQSRDRVYPQGRARDQDPAVTREGGGWKLGFRAHLRRAGLDPETVAEAEKIAAKDRKRARDEEPFEKSWQLLKQQLKEAGHDKVARRAAKDALRRKYGRDTIKDSMADVESELARLEHPARDRRTARDKIPAFGGALGGGFGGRHPPHGHPGAADAAMTAFFKLADTARDPSVDVSTRMMAADALQNYKPEPAPGSMAARFPEVARVGRALSAPLGSKASLFSSRF